MYIAAKSEIRRLVNVLLQNERASIIPSYVRY
jgi:hypothetical protein